MRPTLQRKDLMENMTLKPPLWQVKKGSLKFNAVRYLCFLFHSLLQPCVQMDADTDNHGKKGAALPGADAHIMEMVII